MRSVSYAIVTYGAVAGSLLGSPFGRVVTDPYARLQEPLALPLGELSPQVTERVLPPILNGKIYLLAHTTKTPVNIPVGDSQNIQTKS